MKDQDGMIRGIRGAVGKRGFEGENRGVVIWEGEGEDEGWIVKEGEEGVWDVLYRIGG